MRWERRVGRHERLVLGVGFALVLGKEFGGGEAVLGILLKLVAVALLVFDEPGHFQVGELHIGADGADRFEEGDVLFLEGFLHKTAQRHLAEVVEFEFEQGRVGFLLLEGEDDFIELVQGIGDMPPGEETGEVGGGGVEAELFLEVLDGLGHGAVFEVVDDGVLVIGVQVLEDGVGVGCMHSFNEWLEVSGKWQVASGKWQVASGKWPSGPAGAVVSALADAQFQSGRGLPQSTTWRSCAEGAGIMIKIKSRSRNHAGRKAGGRLRCLLKTVQHTGGILARAGGLLQTLYGLYGLY